MANLNYDSFTESVRTILKLRNAQDDAIVKEIVEACVRDIVEEFDSDIGSRTDYSLKITNVQIPDGPLVSRIYLPEDCHYVRQVEIGNTLVTPVDVTDVQFWRNYRTFVGRLTGLNGFISRDDNGNMYMELTSPITVDDRVPIIVDYRVYSSDISYIPEAYKTLVLYGAVYHYRNWYGVDAVEIQSKAEMNYNKYLSRFRSEQANQNTANKRDYEVEWKRMFRYVLESNVNDLSSRSFYG